MLDSYLERGTANLSCNLYGSLLVCRITRVEDTGCDVGDLSHADALQLLRGRTALSGASKQTFWRIWRRIDGLTSSKLSESNSESNESEGEHIELRSTNGRKMCESNEVSVGDTVRISGLLL